MHVSVCLFIYFFHCCMLSRTGLVYCKKLTNGLLTTCWHAQPHTQARLWKPFDFVRDCVAQQHKLLLCFFSTCTCLCGCHCFLWPSSNTSFLFDSIALPLFFVFFPTIYFCRSFHFCSVLFWASVCLCSHHLQCNRHRYSPAHVSIQGVQLHFQASICQQTEPESVV